MSLQQFPNPAKDIERFRSWVQLIGGEIVGLDDLYIYNNRRVCRKHFEEKWLYPRSRLCSIAIPTLHLQAGNDMMHTETKSQPSMNDTKNEKESKEKGSQSKKRKKKNSLPKTKSSQPDRSTRTVSRTAKATKAKRPQTTLTKVPESFIPKSEASATPGEVPCCTQCGADINARELYRCVQCPLLLMCAECGGDNAHAYHCVLRMPSLLVYNKMDGIFGTLRKLITKTLSKEETRDDEKCDDSDDDMVLSELATSKHQDVTRDAEFHKAVHGSIKQENSSRDEDDKSQVFTTVSQYEISIEPSIPITPANESVSAELKTQKRKATHKQTPEKAKMKKYHDSGTLQESGTTVPIEIKQEVEEIIEIKLEKLDDDDEFDPQQGNIFGSDHGIIDYSNR